MPRVRRHATARADLIEHYVYLATEAGENVAERFITNAESTFALLATQPNMGAPLALRNPELAGMRKWSVEGFENFLIFYLPEDDGITVVRVLHAARDWWALIGVV